jgi:hypothetical protein
MKILADPKKLNATVLKIVRPSSKNAREFPACLDEVCPVLIPVSYDKRSIPVLVIGCVSFYRSSVRKASSLKPQNMEKNYSKARSPHMKIGERMSSYLQDLIVLYLFLRRLLVSFGFFLCRTAIRLLCVPTSNRGRLGLHCYFDCFLASIHSTFNCPVECRSGHVVSTYGESRWKRRPPVCVAWSSSVYLK